MEYVWKSSLWIGIFQRATQRARILLTDNIQSGAAVVSTITSLYIYHQFMLIFFAFDNDDMESSKRRVTRFIVDFSFKMYVEIDRYQMTILLLYLVAWVEFEFCCQRQPINKRILTNNRIKWHWHRCAGAPGDIVPSRDRSWRRWKRQHSNEICSLCALISRWSQLVKDRSSLVKGKLSND